MTRESLAAFRQTVTVAWPQAAAADAKALLLRVAREGNARIVREQTARAGFAPTVEAYANRPGNRNLDSVALPGPIVFKYRYWREIVEVALGALIKASPVRSGAYVQNHTVYVNGLPVAGVPARFEPGDEIMIANPVPYARRLEIGKTKAGRAFVVQVPDRIYERVAKTVARRYGAVARITFGYVSLPGAYAVKGKLSPFYGTGRPGSRGGGVRRKRNQKPGAAVRAPALFIAAR